MTDPISIIEQHFHIELKRKSPTEYAGPCPFCNEGVDRFVVFLDGSPRYWCRRCESQGFVDSLEDTAALSPAEIRLLKIEREQRRLARQQTEQEIRLLALEQMAQCKDHERYHRQMPDAALHYWLSEGMEIDWIAKYKLGGCTRCPLWPSLSSYTVPIFDGGRLLNIRHRLARNGNKRVPRYLPHVKGLGVQLFNADAIETAPDVLAICEGEKKTIHVTERIMPAVGIMGARSFLKGWVKRIARAVSTVYVCLDPDAAESAQRLAAFFHGKARVVELPTKADDFLTIRGGSARDFRYYLKQARPVKAR
ncbi:MAG: hypothetical protein GY832_26030 [Chloroflexi bacterium]|nr:hypothetical protein [Chloroflexota bacterium]